MRLSDIISSRLPPTERTNSQAVLAELLRWMRDSSHDLVFFVGAGISGGSTAAPGFPAVPALLEELLRSALSRWSDAPASVVEATIQICGEAGFEITLNDLWQISQTAIMSLFTALSRYESQTVVPTEIHRLLAYWIELGGTVITTNYDRLIERAAPAPIRTVFRDGPEPNSFESWKAMLEAGGYLFKPHGSLDEPKTCLGALEQVGTEIQGPRRGFLEAVLSSRPICFIGWRGADPDIPQLFARLTQLRSGQIPTFWVHFEGDDPSIFDVSRHTAKIAEAVRGLAIESPIVTESSRLAKCLLEEFGVSFFPEAPVGSRPLDLANVLASLSDSAALRFVGMSLRRARKQDAAAAVLNAATVAPGSMEEQRAANQELAHELWARGGGRDQEEALRHVRDINHRDAASKVQQRVGTAFGEMSMTFVVSRRKPWLLLRIPKLLRRYDRYIADLRYLKDPRSAALHEALRDTYRGRLRMRILGHGPLTHWYASWLLKPFDEARSRIDAAGDIHPHGRIDVLAYRALAYSRCGRCTAIATDLNLIEQLCDVLHDSARKDHWQTRQRPAIDRKCTKNLGHIRKRGRD